MDQKNKTLIIIPAYNEGDNIEKVVDNLITNFPQYDYVIVNDGSRDHTKRVCSSRGYEVLNLPINMGIGGAVQTGYRYARDNDYDIAVQIDGDGQHDVGFLDKMIEYMGEQKADCVIGSRFVEKEGFQSSGLRRLGIRYFSALLWLLTGKRVTDPTSGMRMVNRDVIRIYAVNYPKDYPEPESVMAILRMGKKVTEMPVVMKERKEGTSSIGGLRSVYYMIKVTLAILMERLRR